jgi:hypothetical protein
MSSRSIVGRSADVAVRGGILAFHIGGPGKRLRRRFYEFAITGLLAAGAKNHVVRRLDLRHGDAPLLRGRLFQHHARRCARGVHGFGEVANRAGAVGVLRTVLHIADSLLDFHLRPVGLEFVGGNYGEHAANAGAHFGAMGDDDHRAVLLQAEVNAGMPGGFVGLTGE